MTEEHVEEFEDQTEEVDVTNEAEVQADTGVGDDSEAQSESDDEAESDTFPRSYVEKLRNENAKYRQRAQRSDDLAQRLHTALVEGTGRLQDASDLSFDESHLDDPEALRAAIDDLLDRKPHLAARKITGDIGQGATSSNSTVDLAGILRARA